MITRVRYRERFLNSLLQDHLPPPPPPPSPQLSESGNCSLDGDITVATEIEVYQVEATQKLMQPSNALDGRCMAMIFRYVPRSTVASFLTVHSKSEAQCLGELDELVPRDLAVVTKNWLKHVKSKTQ